MISPRFSAIILTRNEEHQIRECLEHLTWCDERILVDMHSQDRTREQAQGLATVILLHDPIPNFEFARNKGIEAANGDWILIVDADEIIPPPLANRLRECVVTDKDIAGFWIPRWNCCFRRPVSHCSGFPDYQLRCFRRGMGVYPERLHGAPIIRGRTVFLPIEEGVWIIHERKNMTISDVVHKFDVYAETEARNRVTAGDAFEGPLAMLWVALSAFWFRFFTSRGYRDGMAGLVLSILFAFYRFAVEAKTWEAHGYAAGWDQSVERLGSPARIIVALAKEGIRRLWHKARRQRYGEVPPRGDEQESGHV